MRRSLAIGAALLIGGGPACLLRLDDEISCGDGYVDAAAGEECDPALPSSYEDGCPVLGMADCDPVTCELINDAAQCSVCGDDRVDVDRGEECDGDNLGGNVCPGGNGSLQCSTTCMLDYTECEACGNGVVDEGEECDYENVGGFASERPCAGSVDDEVEPLSSPDKPFVSGSTTVCRTDCRWDRSGCGFCGDGVRDDALPVQEAVSSAVEWCDGEIFDDGRLIEVFGNLCDDPEHERPAVACGDDCRSFVAIDNGCCLRHNAACPEGEMGEPPSGLPCCWAVSHPGEDPCYTSFEADGSARRLCR